VSTFLAIILFVLAFAASLIGYEILDRRHQQKAWREATRMATEIMKRERDLRVAAPKTT
jgi:hypothetical protein